MPRGVPGSGPHAGRARKRVAAKSASQAAKARRGAPVAAAGTPGAPAGASTEPCTVPPKGWRCTRVAGHDGPCAAEPVEPTDEELGLMDDRKPLGSIDVRSLVGDRLKRYARRAGVSQRDVDSLTEDRLRQNTALTIETHFEALHGG